MNNQDQFIYNFLEGNLNKSEHQLCNELIATDPEFREKVNAWKLSYYNSDSPRPYFENKQELLPKSKRIYWLLLGVLFSFSFLGYHMYTQIKVKDELQLQVDQLEVKLSDSLIKRNKTNKRMYEVKTNQKRSFKKDKLFKENKSNTSITNKNKQIDKDLFYGSVISNNDVVHEEEVLLLLESNEFEKEDNVVEVQSLSEGIKDTIMGTKIITQEQVKEEQTTSAKKRKGWKGWLKNQHVVPMN